MSRPVAVALVFHLKMISILKFNTLIMFMSGEQDVRSQSAREQSKKHVFDLTAVERWSELFFPLSLGVRSTGVSFLVLV